MSEPVQTLFGAEPGTYVDRSGDRWQVTADGEVLGWWDTNDNPWLNSLERFVRDDDTHSAIMADSAPFRLVVEGNQPCAWCGRGLE
jgi:hypothetical protein